MANIESYMTYEICTPIILFVYTYVAKLQNLNISFVEITELMIKHLNENIIGINSNFGHATLPGYEKHIKTAPKKKNTRKTEGDGTCFHSAIEPIINIDTFNKKGEKKLYFIKCFPTTGITQIPGGIENNYEDANKVLSVFTDYLNKLNVSDKEIIVTDKKPNMLNYKFKIIFTEERLLVNLMDLYIFLNEIDVELSPYKIRELKGPITDTKTSFKFDIEEKNRPRVIIFQSGKINILGAKSTISVEHIYNFIKEIFKQNWTKFVKLRPIPSQKAIVKQKRKQKQSTKTQNQED